MCPRQASGVSVEVQPVFLCSWQELLGDLELTRIGLEHGMPVCDLGLTNFQEQEGM